MAIKIGGSAALVFAFLGLFMLSVGALNAGLIVVGIAFVLLLVMCGMSG